MEKPDWEKAPAWATRRMRNINIAIPDCWADDELRGLWVTENERCEFELVPDVWTLVETRQPVKWNGQGIPPVGIDCEFTHTGLDGEWVKCHVVGYYMGHLYGHTDHHLWGHKNGACHVQLDEGLPTAVVFRPIRTPEQIGAEEREAAVDEMAAPFGYAGVDESVRGMLYNLYDRGYRRQATCDPHDSDD